LHDAARVALDRQSECTTLVRTLDRIVAQLSDASSNAFVTSQHDVDAIQSEAALQKLCTTQAARLKTLKQNVESQRNTLSEQRRKQFEAERLVEEALARVESLTVNLKVLLIIIAGLMFQIVRLIFDFNCIVVAAQIRDISTARTISARFFFHQSTIAGIIAHAITTARNTAARFRSLHTSIGSFASSGYRVHVESSCATAIVTATHHRFSANESCATDEY
jgi:hypothetical protein